MRFLILRAAIVVGWIGLVFFPLLFLFWQAPIVRVFDPVILSVVKSTLLQAVLTTLISTIVGLAFGLYLGAELQKENRWAQLSFRLLLIPFGIPTVVAALSWILWLGREGPLSFLDSLYSLRAVILAHVFFNIPFVAYFVAEARAAIPVKTLETARSLGAHSWRIFFDILRPLLQPTVISLSAQVFSFCVMSFALVMILGGGPPNETLETQIYASIRTESFQWDLAFVAALWQIALTVLPWALVLYSERKRENFAFRFESKGSAQTGTPMVLLGGVFLIPYFIIFQKANLQFSWDVLWALFRSLALSFFVGITSLILAMAGIVSAWNLKKVKSFKLILFQFPAGLSTLVLSLAFVLVFSRWIDPFRYSLIFLILVQAILFCPLWIRLLWPLMKQFPYQHYEMARSLGALPIKAFLTADGPRWLHMIRSLYGMIFVASLGEIAAISFFSTGDFETLPLLISRAIGRYRFDEAWAASILLLILCLGLPLLWHQKLGKGRRTG